MFEHLEDRRLMSGSAELIDGVLVIRGTDGDDVIDISIINERGGDDPLTVTINGSVTGFDAGDVDSIAIQSFDGDDRITLDGHITVGTSIHAGAGDDHVIGSFGKDTIHGSAGDDTLVGARGADVLFGGRGRDLLKGAGGNDYLHAGSDDDLLKDYRGRNVFHGGSGDDEGLVDPDLLGSSVESRTHVTFHPVSGDLELHDVDNVQHTGTQLFWRNGRLILDYHFSTGSISYDVRFSGVTRRSDGTMHVQVTITEPPRNFPAVQYFAHRWDVTGAEARGLVFTTVYAKEGSEDVVRKTTTLLRPKADRITIARPLKIHPPYLLSPTPPAPSAPLHIITDPNEPGSFATLKDGMLTILGTKGEDDISMNFNNDELRDLLFVTINGRTQHYDMEGVRNVKVRAGRGDDNIGVNDDLPFKPTVFGGDGYDVLRAGKGHAKFFGGPGTDRYEVPSKVTLPQRPFPDQPPVVIINAPEPATHPALGNLHAEYVEFLRSGKSGPFESTNPSVVVRGDFVYVEIDSSDVRQARERLFMLGMERLSVDGSVITGRLPIASINKLEFVPGIRSARPDRAR